MEQKFDGVVLGGGVNGFAAAITLARRGAKVALVDAQKSAGGMLSGDAPLGLYGPQSLSPRLMHELDLSRYGLVLAPFGGIALATPGAEPLMLSRNLQEMTDAICALDKGEASRFQRLRTEMSRVRTMIDPLFEAGKDDPLALQGTAGFVEMLEHGTRLGRGAVFDALNLTATSCAERLVSDLRCDPLRVLIAAAALSGQGQGPMSPGSALSLAFLPIWQKDVSAPLHFGGFPVGGWAALSNALTAAATAAGVTLHMGTRADRITSHEGAVSGVILSSGEELATDLILSSLDARQTMGRLMDWNALPEQVSRRINRSEVTGNVARMQMTVSSLDVLPSDLRLLKPMAIYVAESLHAMDLAADEAALGYVPETPWLDIAIPSLADPTASPEGPFDVTVSIHHTPWRLVDGTWDEDHKDRLTDEIIAKLNAVWPGFRSRVTETRLWLPSEIAGRYGIAGGHLTGGDLSPDRLMWSRPAPELCGFRAPVRGLYLCGRDAHGAPGQGGLGGVAAAVIAANDRDRAAANPLPMGKKKKTG